MKFARRGPETSAMPKIRRIVGHVEVEVALKKRKCHRGQGHVIERGEACLAIYDGPRGARKNYCGSCAGPILAAAREDLAHLERQLDGAGSAVSLAARPTDD